MIPFKSTVSKIVIFVTPDIDNSDVVQEVVIFGMHGVKVLYAMVLGVHIDEESSQSVIEDIFNEETDSRFISREFTIFHVKNVAGDNSLFIEEIYSVLNMYTNHTNGTDTEIEYIIYNDAAVQPEFFSNLEEYISDQDDSLIPTHFADIYTYDPDIDSLIQKFDIKDHMHSKDSSISNALYTGIFFDISIGK